MALEGSRSTLIAFFISSLFAVASAQPSSSSCTSTLISLSPCLNFITGNETAPSSSCCSKLGSVVKSEPQCLCTVLDGGAASGLGISINKTQALALPAACKVQTQSVSQCNTSSSPPSTETPSAPSSPSGGGSKNVPSVGAGSSPNGSAAAIISAPLLLLTLLFTAVFSFASALNA